MGSKLKMLRERLNAYFALPSIEDNEEQLRVWVLRRMILFGICTNTIAVAFAISNPRFLLELMVAYGLLFGALLLLEYCVRHHKVRAVAWGLALLAWAWLVLMAALQGPFGAQGGFRYTTIAIVLATFILGTGPGFLFLALTALAGLAFWLLGPATEGMMLLRVDSDQEQLLSYMLVLAMLYVLIATGRAVLLQSLRQTQTAQAESEARQVSLAQAYADVERQVQARTQELEATLRQQEDLLHIVAHDLKNPLSGLALTLDLMARYPDRLGQQKMLDRIKQARHTVDMMTGTISRMLEAEQYEAGQVTARREMLQPAPLLEAIVAEYQRQAEMKGIELIVLHQPAPPPIWADSQLLTQVLANLLSNALKYSPAGTTVSLDWSREQRHLAIRVRDEGLGLTLEDMGGLYRKFTRLSARPTAGESSAGLGLYIVKLFTEAMSGSVVAESAGRHKGTTFTIRLPLAETKQAVITTNGSGLLPEHLSV
ncbi:MAG: HAMP domain-containing histidine kinase [Anaerolineales bacterium]|nr:HAMP domain-containing histidine kinase [Anaerolineales bacterium]